MIRKLASIGLVLGSVHLTRVEPDTVKSFNGKVLTVKRAKVNGARIAPGTYDASSSAISGYITDSATGGSLVVTGAGLRMIVR